MPHNYNPFQPRALADLPNHSGYQFIGIDHDDRAFRCVVRKDALGMHSVYDADGTPCFVQLKAWRVL